MPNRPTLSSAPNDILHRPNRVRCPWSALPQSSASGTASQTAVLEQRLGQRAGQLSWGCRGRQDSIRVTGAREQGLVPGASTKWALHIVTSLDLLQAVAGTRGLWELALASMVPRDLQLCVRWRAGHAVTSQCTVWAETDNTMRSQKPSSERPNTPADPLLPRTQCAK